MLKKSFIVVVIQILGSLLGLLTLYLIAGDMEPEIYSLVGIYSVLASITLTFSDLGIETTMMREALYWKEKNESEKEREYSTQAILSRIMGFVALLPFLLTYVLIINYTKYNGQYTGILLLFLIGAEVNSLNNAMSLIVRSQGGYVFAQFASTVNNYFLKFVGIGLYILLGTKAYLIFYGISSIPLAIVYFVKLRKNFDFSYLKIKNTVVKIWEGRYLWLRTDLDYFKNNSDSLIVSAVFPAGIMGSYSIYKQLEQLSKSLIEGFFDVLSQHSVKYKGDKAKLIQYERKFRKVVVVAVVLIVICIGGFMTMPEFFVNLVHLTKYQDIQYMIICVGVVSIIYLLGKYEVNALAFFGSSKMNFGIGIATFMASVLSYAIVVAQPTVLGVLIQRVAIFGFMTIISIILFNKNKEKMYMEVLK